MGGGGGGGNIRKDISYSAPENIIKPVLAQLATDGNC